MLHLSEGDYYRIFYAMVAALFRVFIFSLVPVMKRPKNPLFFDYKTAFTAHEWELWKAEGRLGALKIDIKEAPTYCRFTTDSVYFTEKEMVYHFDEGGKLVHGEYEISPCGSYPYTIKDDEIKIENQIFTITSTDSSYVFSNADWRLVLINK